MTTYKMIGDALVTIITRQITRRYAVITVNKHDFQVSANWFSDKTQPCRSHALTVEHAKRSAELVWLDGSVEWHMAENDSEIQTWRSDVILTDSNSHRFTEEELSVIRTKGRKTA